MSLGKMVHKGQNHVAVEQQSLAFPRMGDIGELMRRNTEPGCEDFPVPGGLIEHVDKVGVLKDVLHLAGGKQVLDVLGDPCWHPAPFAESFPDLNGVRRGLFLLKQQVELVQIAPGGLASGAVGRYAAQI